MSGIHIRITDASLEVAQAIQGLSAPGFGAQLLFAGVVREENLGKRVQAVSYDAFIPLAEATLREIASEARQRHGKDVWIWVEHRTGKLTVGEISVIIGTASPHRDEAYQASRYVIEELKKRVPIWKKEHYEDGETDWLRGHALCGHSPASHDHCDPAGGR